MITSVNLYEVSGKLMFLVLLRDGSGEVYTEDNVPDSIIWLINHKGGVVNDYRTV